ncbi:MAG: DegT/DnrJ/EryC1/StrS family aminotransferase, partial [Casimicrobium sp.]
RHRRHLAAHYLGRLKPILDDSLLPHAGHADDQAGHSWNLFAIRLPLDQLKRTRAEIMDAMKAFGIATSVSYESPHLTTVFRKQGWKTGDLPNTELIASTTLTLPLHAGLNESDIDYVCDSLASVLTEARR